MDQRGMRALPEGIQGVAAGGPVLPMVIGSFFAVAGTAKLTWSPLPGVPPGPEGFAVYLDSAGVPFPLPAAWAVCILELTCGTGLVVGRWWPTARRAAPIFAGLLAIEMAVAMTLVGVPTALGRPVLIDGQPVTAEWFRLPLELGLFLALVSIARRGRRVELELEDDARGDFAVDQTI